MKTHNTNIASHGAAGFGNYLQAIRKFESGARDDRVMAALGMNEQVDAEGGFLVPQEMANDLMNQIENQSSILPYCLQLPAKTYRTVLPGVDESSRANGSRFGGVSSAWTQEATAIAPSKPKFRGVEIELEKLVVAAYVTEELQQGSELLGSFISNAFSLEGAFKVDEAIVRGSGAGDPLGLINSPALVTVQKDSGQAAGTLSASNVENMFSRMLPASRKRAVWLVGTQAEEALYQLSSANPALAMLVTPGDTTAPFGRLMQRPIIPCEQCSVIGTAGDILCVDLSLYAVVSKPLTIQRSEHVAFLSGENVYRLILRIDGQPLLKNPIVPYNGGPAQSAYVALAPR